MEIDEPPEAKLLVPQHDPQSELGDVLADSIGYSTWVPACALSMAIIVMTATTMKRMRFISFPRNMNTASLDWH